MYSAILYLKNGEEELSKIKIFDKSLIEYTINELRRLAIDDIYVVGNINIDGLIKRDELKDIFNELKYIEGKTLLLSPFYPLIEKDDYEELLKNNNNAVFIKNEEVLKIFSIDNSLLNSYDKLSYDGIMIDDKKGKCFKEIKDLPYFFEEIKERNINKWLNKGVIILDPKNTMIGQDVYIDKGTYIYPNTYIGGKSFIGFDNIIKGCVLNDVVVGDKNYIEDSNIKNSVIYSNCNIGPKAIINESEIFDDVKVESFVRIENSKIEKKTNINHLSYIGDAQIGTNVLIGSGVNTINYDGRSKHQTIIKSHSTIGSNVNIIAPVTIGEYAMVSAGSTIDEDVKDGDLAIARLYQQNKKGYGYRHNRED